MADIPVEQAIYGNVSGGGYRFLARSPGFREEWLHEAERLCTGFGERPAGVACPHAIFAHPMTHDLVAVVQVADQGTDDAGRPGALAFHLLVLSKREYEQRIGDPFVIADRFPPPWETRDDLPMLNWPAEHPHHRSVEEIQNALKTDNSATLLGGAQALVDGSKIVFERLAPDPTLLRKLWLMLPTSTRCHLWPATFAFGNSLRFDVLVVPRADETTYAGYLNEVQAGDYPEGRYELSLQVAAEAGNQRDLDALFARRNSAQTLRLAVVILVGITVLAAVLRVMTLPPPGTPRPSPPPGHAEKPPLTAKYPKFSSAERVEVAQALHRLAKALGMPEQPPKATVDQLLRSIDDFLDSHRPTDRSYTPVSKLAGTREGQLRALLWKHHVDGFDDPALNGVEQVERLEKNLLATKGAP